MDERQKAARWLASAERDYQTAVADCLERKLGAREELVRAKAWLRLIQRWARRLTSARWPPAQAP